MKYIGQMTNLENLGLDQTSVTMAGLAELKNLKKMRRLYLSDTDEFRRSRKMLEQEFPKACIELLGRSLKVDSDLNRIFAPLR
jgi:hypothetical protein